MDKRIKRAQKLKRHMLPSGKFYYEIYQAKTGEFFSDPATVNCETEEELRAALNRQKTISMKTPAHFARMTECNQLMQARQGTKK